MTRAKFPKGEQRKFLIRVIENLESPSLRALLQRGISVRYSALKNYYSEYRFISEKLLNDLCILAKINKNTLKFEEIPDYWGQQKGGKVRKRRNKFKRS